MCSAAYQLGDLLANEAADELLVKEMQARSSACQGDGAAAARSNRAWGEFLRRYGPFLHDRARRCGARRVDVAEIVHLVHCVVFVKLPRFQWQNSERFRGWLFAIVRSQVAKHFRDSSRKSAQDLSSLLNTELEPETRAEGPALLCERQERCALAGVVLAQLRVKSLEVNFQLLWLHHVEGWRIVDVAADLGMKPGQARVRLCRTVALFWVLWKRHGGDA
jgi:RNA polymerase sigma factor (sigma-70 family)